MKIGYFWPKGMSCRCAIGLVSPMEFTQARGIEGLFKEFRMMWQKGWMN